MKQVRVTRINDPCEDALLWAGDEYPKSLEYTALESIPENDAERIDLLRDQNHTMVCALYDIAWGRCRRWRHRPWRCPVCKARNALAKLKGGDAT